MVAFVLAASIKLTPAILIFYHLGKRRFRFAAVCAAILIAVSALSFAPFGSAAPEAVRTFVQRTVKNGQGFDLAYSGNQSLRGVIARVRGDSETTARDPGDTMTMAGAVALLALATFVAFRSRNSNGAIASLFCCIALLSPLAWKAHFVVLIFPAAFLVSQLSRDNPGRRFLSAAALIAAFSLFNLTSPRIVGLAASEWADQHSLVFAAAMLMYAASLVCSFESRANDKPSPVC
jgi:alpha-1,2-mannosyltransferase